MLTPFDRATVSVCKLIGVFYLEKNCNDYASARDEILRIDIQEVLVVPDIVVIKTSRPGMLIGKRGENLDKLHEYLSKHLQKPIRIHIIEVNGFTDLLMPYEEPIYESFPDYPEEPFVDLGLEDDSRD